MLLLLYITYLEVCPPPPDITDGYFTLQGGVNQTSGAVAIDSCNDNFALFGDQIHTCVGGLTWDMTPPICNRMYILYTFKTVFR